MVNQWWCVFLISLFWLLAACSPAPEAVSKPPTPPLSQTITITSTFLAPVKKTLTPLPSPFLPPIPVGGTSWPVKDPQSLRQQLRDAQVIMVSIKGFRYCPSSYDHDRQPKTDQKACTNLEFELGEQQRQQLIEAIDDETQAGQIPEALLGGGSPITGLPYPMFKVSLILTQFRLDLEWATERSFVVYQSYYGDNLQNTWDLQGELRQGQVADVGFVQEKPLLYQAIKILLPAITFPPEYPAHILTYERVVVTYDEKKCAYNNGSFPSFTNFIQDILNRSVPVTESRPAGKPRAVFTFSVRGQTYPLEIWENGRFSYAEKIYEYTPLTFGTSNPYTEPPLGKNLEDILLELKQFTECKAPQ